MNARDIEEDDGVLVFWLAGKNSWRPGREREGVVLGPEARKALAPWLAAAGKDGWLFPTARPTRARHYTTASYGRAVGRAFEDNPKLAPWTPYQLRHSCKKRVTRAFGLDAARAVLRQASIQTTDRYAATRDMQTAKDVAKKTG